MAVNTRFQTHCDFHVYYEDNMLGIIGSTHAKKDIQINYHDFHIRYHNGHHYPVIYYSRQNQSATQTRAIDSLLEFHNESTLIKGYRFLRMPRGKFNYEIFNNKLRKLASTYDNFHNKDCLLFEPKDGASFNIHLDNGLETAALILDDLEEEKLWNQVVL